MNKYFLLVCVLFVGLLTWVSRANTVKVVAQTGEFVSVLAQPINDGSTLHSVWSGATNSLYIVSPDGAYTNLLMTTIGE